jgi:hypothetical protein
MAVGFPIYLATYLLAAPEAKFGKARFLLMVFFGALVYMLPPLFHSNAWSVSRSGIINKGLSLHLNLLAAGRY